MAKTPHRPAVHPIAEGGPIESFAPVPPMPPLPQTRVGKSLHPGRAGTLKLQRRFGAPLLLVRYRYDWTGLYRYTTVELLVGAEPVTRGHGPRSLYAVRLGPNEASLKAAARQLGGHWDPQLLRWTLPGHAIQALDLSHRVELAQVIRQPGQRPTRRR